jgi:hypothetical protein
MIMRVTKRKVCVPFAMLLLMLAGQTAGKYSGGTGEPNDPYRIVTPQDLNDIGNYEEDWHKHFVLVNDVNLAEYTGTQFKIIGPFSGVFDGNNHKISNFTLSSTGRDYIGLFGYVGAGVIGGVPGKIRNLGLENVDVNAVNGDCVGGLAGASFWGSSITNCYLIGSVSGNHSVGGLVGENDGAISNCYSSGSVSGDGVVGGLVGYNDSTITDCYSTGSVTGDWRVGGLVGYNDSTITDCYSTGSVASVGQVGGLVGDNGGTISNCYSTGSVSGTGDYVGGLVGHNWDAIRNCYSTGSISGEAYVGGLVGYSTVIVSYSRIINCYSTGVVDGHVHVGGLLGSGGREVVSSFWDVEISGQSTSSAGIGKTTAEMKTMSIFTEAGWDFVEIWGIGENQTYPYLMKEPAGDSNHDKKVDLLDLAILASHWLEGT